ncbi:MAG TPA: serine hydrolase domain-containing protein [Gammaproteobacteria bacterium]
MRLRSTLLCALLLTLAACSTNPPVKPAEAQRGDYRYVQEYLRWQIHKEMESNDITGLSIALVDDQRVVWAQGFGFADLENQVAATAQTPYRLGSMAKILTASAAMRMAEEGRLDLDAPLSQALPGFSIKSRFSNAAPITPRNIMTHHSGLPSNYLQGMVTHNPKYFTTLVEDIRDEYVAYPPNLIFDYSNLAVTLLGAAIENRSGMPYGDYIAQAFFEPLGMRHSYFSVEPALKGYSDGKPSEPLPLRDLPSGGLVSSVEDMARFMKMVFAGGKVGEQQVLSEHSLAEMFRPQNEHVALDLGRRMGLGWMLSGYDVQNGGVVAGHGGSVLSFQSTMIVLPEQRLGVVVAANSTSARGVVSELAETALKLALEAKAGITQPPAQQQPAAIRPLSEAEAQHYAGYFDSLVGLVKIDNHSGNLDAEVLGHAFRLTPREDGSFGIRYKLFGLIPVSVAALDKISFAMKPFEEHELLEGHIGNESLLFGERLNKTADITPFLDFVGSYEIVNSWEGGVKPESLALRQEGGMLIAECSFAQIPGLLLRMAITPISPSEAVVAGIGVGRGETLRLVRDAKEKRVYFSGLELHKIN